MTAPSVTASSVVNENWVHARYNRISTPAHNSNVVTCIQVDDNRIVTGSDDRTIEIRDLATGKLQRTLMGHEGGIWALQFWNNTLVTASTDKTVRVWNMESGVGTHVFRGFKSTARCLVLLIPEINKETGQLEPDVPLIVAGNRDATLRIWRLPDLERDQQWHPAAPDNASIPPVTKEDPFLRSVLTGHMDSVRAIAGHGNTIVSGSYDSTVRVWDVVDGRIRHVCRGHQEKVYSVGYCHELEQAASGSMDTSIKVWSTRTGEMLFDLRGHTSLVGLIAVSAKYIISAAADSTLRVWSPTAGECLAELTAHPAAITGFTYDLTSRKLVSGSDGGIMVWDLNSINLGVPGKPVAKFLGEAQGVWRVWMDQRRVVCAVQRYGGRTWIEILDFAESDTYGNVVELQDSP
ncbi:SCF ubiquitin ligase complex subunit cdc4 [Geranomyces michiganensis]|nr:SCF ubiquitin ligase complex subunit cdc4 [Geranomyces michiganensis]